MKITSVYVNEKNIAFVTLEVEAQSLIKLIDVWQSKPSDKSFFDAIKAQESDLYLFNGIMIEQKPHSALAESLQRRGLKNTKVIPPIPYTAGIEIVKELEAKNEIILDNHEEWPVIAQELDRVEKHQTPRVLALLQGAVEAEKEIGKKIELEPEDGSLLGSFADPTPDDYGGGGMGRTADWIRML